MIMKCIKRGLIAVISILLFANILSAENDPQTAKEAEDNIYLIKLDRDIDRSAMRMINLGIREAVKIDSKFIILDLNTYGGAVDAADSIRTAILQSPIPVVAFINVQAASAGALISIACDSIYMRTGSSIGAATVVNQTGEVMPDKYQSFMRGMMRSTAEAHGKKVVIQEGREIEVWHRDPKIAEAMVSADTVLTFTPEEAIINGYCEGKAESVDEVMGILGVNDYEIVEQEFTTIQKIILFLMSPFLQSIFMMMIIGGIYFELQSPGVGLPGALALLGAVLYFSPLYIEGIAMYWEIIFFVIGIILLFVEIFVTPGFGFIGISGIIIVIFSLVFAMVDNDMLYRFGEVNYSLLFRPITLVFVSLFVGMIGSIWLVGRLYPNRTFSHIALRTELTDNQGYVAVNTEISSFIGMEVVAQTDMFPSGKIDIDGRRYEATMEWSSAKKGDLLKIIKVEGGRLYCEKV